MAVLSPPIWPCEGDRCSAAVTGVPVVLLHPSSFPIALAVPSAGAGTSEAGGIVTLGWLKSEDFDVGDEAWNDSVGCD